MRLVFFSYFNFHIYLDMGNSSFKASIFTLPEINEIVSSLDCVKPKIGKRSTTKIFILQSLFFCAFVAASVKNYHAFAVFTNDCLQTKVQLLISLFTLLLKLPGNLF